LGGGGRGELRPANRRGIRAAELGQAGNSRDWGAATAASGLSGPADALRMCRSAPAAEGMSAPAAVAAAQAAGGGGCAAAARGGCRLELGL
jgi:hypothetical protein